MQSRLPNLMSGIERGSRRETWFQLLLVHKVLDYMLMNCYPKSFISSQHLIYHFNKTTGYHRHIFRPPIFLKMPFKKMKTSFFLENTLIYFPIFPLIKIFLLFLQKTSQIMWKRHFKEKISFDTHFTASLLPWTILKKIEVFFEKKHLFFFQKN